jgi:hypothetical protein
MSYNERMDTASDLRERIRTTEQTIVDAERAEREGYRQLAQLRTQLAEEIVERTPFDASAIDEGQVVEQILGAWTGMLRHRWEPAPVRHFAAGPGWVFRAAAGEDPSQMELSLEPAALDECDELIGVPRRCTSVHSQTVHTVSPALVHQLDEQDLAVAVSRLVMLTTVGPAQPEGPETLGSTFEPPVRSIA